MVSRQLRTGSTPLHAVCPVGRHDDHTRHAALGFRQGQGPRATVVAQRWSLLRCRAKPPTPRVGLRADPAGVRAVEGVPIRGHHGPGCVLCKAGHPTAPAPGALGLEAAQQVRISSEVWFGLESRSKSGSGLVSAQRGSAMINAPPYTNRSSTLALVCYAVAEDIGIRTATPQALLHCRSEVILPCRQHGDSVASLGDRTDLNRASNAGASM